MMTWPKIVWNSLAATVVLIVSLVSSTDAQAGYRHGGYGGHGGGRAYAGHVRYVAPLRAVHVNPVRTAIAYTSRPYTVASYAPRSYGYGGYHIGHNAGHTVRYAAPVYVKPVRQVRYVHYQPTAYDQSGYSTLQRRAYAPRARCSC
jgi:hypothetical protein